MTQQITNRRKQQTLNAPFRLKSAGISLVVILTIGAYYIANMLSLWSRNEGVPDGALSLTITTVVLMIVVEVAMQIVLFIGAGRIEDHTERDKAIAAQAAHRAYFILTAGVFATAASMFAGVTPFQMSAVLLTAFLLAEIVKFGSQIVYYGRSA